MNVLRYRPGFRLSTIDLIVLVFGTLGSVVVTRFDLWFGLSISFLVVHFLLFCNVFRVSRSLELLWAALFLLLIVSTMTVGAPGWIFSFVLLFFCSMVIIAFQMRQPSYHGIGWKYINPDLPYWWDANEQSRVPERHGVSERHGVIH